MANIVKKLLVIGLILLLVCVSIPSTGTIILENVLPTELIIDGPTSGKVGEPLKFNLMLIDPEGCEFYLSVDWDDGTSTGWTGPYLANEEIKMGHTWNECGVYTIQAIAECNSSYYNATFEVKITSSKTLYVGGDGPENYSKIQDAINIATDGDTVFVYNGKYVENIDVDKSIELIGEDKESTVIDGNRTGNTVSITTQRVKITGFKIKNGIKYNNQFICGIFISSSNCTVSGNIILNNTNGIGTSHLAPNDVFNITITNNIINSSDWRGIFIFNVDNSTVSKNIINYCEFIGLSIADSKNSYVQDNVINVRDAGGLALSTCSNTIVTGNIIKSSKYYGILLYSSNPLNDGACNNLISGNAIINNRYGINIEDSSNNNIIEKNNFIGNKIQALLECSLWNNSEYPCNNSWRENYWDNWIGNKLNLSIFQKFPKIIIGWRGFNNFIPFYFNFDWNPAQEPYDI